MAEKKSWRDYSKDNTTEKETSSEKTGTWRDYSSDNSTGSSERSGGWRDHSKYDVGSAVGSNVINKVNKWLNSHSTYVSDYQKRNSGRKYSYEDSYVSDSGEWLEKARKQKSDYDTEADEILSYINQYKSYLDADWVSEITRTISGARSNQNKIIEAYTKDNEWWSNFKDETEYQTAGRYDGYNKKYSGQKRDDIQKALETLEDGEEKYWLQEYQYKLYEDDPEYTSKAASGMKSYEAQRIAELQKKTSKTWWEEVAESYAYSSADTSLPAAAISNAVHSYRSDTSYKEPNEKWSDGQKMEFGYRYAESPEKAYAYAEQVNNQIKAKEAYLQQQAVGGWASQNVGTGTLGTLGAIATAPLGLADFLDNIVEYSARGTITQKGALSPFDMGQAATSGISDKLNSYGTLDEDMFAVGGKGWGDVYSLGVSAANSLVSAYTLGGTGTLVNFIGQGGASGVDEALARGAKPGQALLYGSIVGAAEGVTEMINADNLLKIGSSSTLKNYLLKALNQGIGESVEEGASSLIGNIADNIIMQDKSNFNAMVKELMEADPNMTEEEAKKKAWLRMVGDVAFDAMGGFVTGSTNAMAVGGVSTALDARKGNQNNIDAVKQYGDKTEDLIQEGLTNDKKSDSYKLATKYQKQTQGTEKKAGKAMTGAQIRNLLAANQEQITAKDIEKIENAAAKRLATLGQREDVLKTAKLATKYATGGKLTASERSFLARSQYGAQAASELLPDGINPDKLLSRWENDMTDGMANTYSTEWRENIGTKTVNRAAYDKKSFDAEVRTILEQMASLTDPNAYKSLESRVETEESAKVSDTGKAVIRTTGKEIDLSKPNIKEITKDGVILEVDGELVNSNDIDYANEDQWYAMNAISKIEHITPAVAGTFISELDMTKPVGQQLNGMDEAFNYGFYNYSEADLKAGDFTGNLTQVQLNDAYKLGQYVRGKTDIDADAPVVKMRTEADAKLSAEQKLAKQKARIESDDVEVYFEDGGTAVKFDEHTGKYDKKRMAAVNTAKLLSKLGIGGKYYFFESYLSKTLKDEEGNRLRVYKDTNGNEVEAPNGIFKEADGSIHVDLNAGDYGQGTALFTMGHELAHFVKRQSKKQFKILGDLVTEAFDKTDLSMRERVLAKQKFLEEKRGEDVSYDEAYEEVVADAMSTMLSDGTFHEKLMEIKVKDKGLFATIKRFFEKMIAKFRKEYENLTPDQRDAQDIRAMKDMFDKIQTAFAEALVEASENFHASEQVLAQAGITVNAETESGSLQSVRDVLNESDRNKVAKALAERFGVTVQEAKNWLKAETSLASIILNPKYSVYLDYEGDPNEVAIKQNSDYPQGTVDFSNICKKRREFTQVMNRILRNFPNHVFAATDLAKIRTIMGEEGMTLPCGICYVEDRRQLDTIVAQDFINGLKLYREGSKTRPDGKPFNANQLKGLQLTDGDTYVPTIYELVSLEGRNSLKAKNPNMEAAWVKYNNARGMQAVRLLTNEAEYKRQILKYNKSTVQSKNDHGGLRIYSFSDAEMFHLIDIVQVITDSATVGLKLQGYTKVNEYAKAVKDTGEKLNRSLIPKGDLGYHMENGKAVLDYDTVEGIDIYSKDFFDNKDNPNVGNITIGINDVQIRAAMLSDFVDQIIPFHTGQSEEVLGEKGIAAWGNYKDYQTEKDIATGKTSSHQINIYTEVFQAAEEEGKPIQNKRQFVEKFLQVCKENNLQPRFAQFLNTDANGDYIYTEGYHKFLVDFKTFAQTETGEYLPQTPVKPIFDDAYITGLLKDYVEEQKVKDTEVAEQMPKVIDRITNEIVKPGEKHSDRKSQKTFKRDQNDNGVFVANVLIDLAEKNSKWWTGTYNHVIFSMSKNDDTEFTQFHQEIEKRTKDMGDYGDGTNIIVNDTFTVQDGNGNEYIYVVKLDGYLHGVVLEKIDKAKYAAAFLQQTKGGTYGKSLTNIKRRTRVNRTGFGQNNSSSSGNRTSSGNTGHGGLGGGSPQSDMAGIDGRESSANRKVHAVSKTERLDGLSARAKWLREQLKRDRVSDDTKTEYRKELREIQKEMSELIKGYYPNREAKAKHSDRDSSGRQLTNAQQEFFKYSVVRDENGDLLVMYHGTANGGAFTIFDGDQLGNAARTSQVGQGFYFTNAKKEAKSYTKNVDIYGRTTKGKNPYLHEVYLNITNPFDIVKDTLNLNDVKAVYGAGTYAYFFDSWIPFYLDRKSVNGEVLSKDAVHSMSKEEKVSLYVDYLAQLGPKELLSNMVRAFPSGKQSELLATMNNRLGYDGIVEEYAPGKYQYVAFSSDQIKAVDNNNPTPNPDIRYSERGEGTSNRHLLANAFEGITQNSEEYKLIQEYRDHIKKLNELDEKLSDLNSEIREIRFTEGRRDADRLAQLEEEAKEIAKEINKHDKRLLSLEASEPLRKVIDRERKKEAQKTKEHVKEIQQNKKLRAEQTELRHKIRKTIRDLDKILNRGNKKVNVKEDMQNVVSTALKAADILFTDNYDSLDMLRNGLSVDLSDSEEALVNECTRMLKNIDKMPTDGYDSWQARQEAENKLKLKMSKLKEVFTRERKRLNNTQVSDILGQLAEAYYKLQESEYSYIQGAYIEPVYTFLKNLQTEVGGTIVSDMTKDQLESVYAAYKMVLTTVRKANQMFNTELKLSREQLGNAVIEEVLKAGGVNLLGTKMGDAISQFDWNNTKPIWVANRIGSETFGKLIQGLFKGQYNFAVGVDEAKQFKLSMDEKYHPRNWDAEKLYKFESSTGKEFSLNLQQIMSLYAFSKREQAYSHLLNGGFVFEDNSTVVVDRKLGIPKTYIHKGATSYKLNEATLNGIINSLTAEQKAYVDDMQKYLSEVMGAKGNEVSMQLYGIQMFKEKFYFPLRSSGAYMERAKEAEMKKQQGQINLVNSGFTHSVKPEAKNPIILSNFMDVWAEHCNEMSMYHSMVLPMEDFRKVYNYSTIHDESMDSASVYQTIQDAYGKAATNYIDQLYRELNAGATIDPRETLYKKLISNFKKAAVMLSGSVWIQQFSSIGRAYAVIDPKYFVGAKVNSNTNLSATEEMKKYAPVAIIKEMGGFDTGTKGSAKNYIMAEQYGKGERLKGFAKDAQYRGDIMGFAPAKADEMTWNTIWEAAKRETKAMHPKMDVKSEEFLKLAGDRFSEVIEKTQVYDSVLARSANMRSKTGLMAMATAFMAEPTTTINLLEDALRGRSVKKIARAFGSVAASIVLNNALASVVYAMRDDDDDETFIEKYFQSFTSGMIDDINPMTYYPFLKDIYSLFQGYDVERADMSVIADLRDALKKAITLVGKDTSSMDDEKLAEHWKNVNGALMSVLDAGFSALGVPEKNVRRDIKGIINAYRTIKSDVTERDTTWNSFLDKVGAAAKDTVPIYAFTKDRSKTDKLYETILSGDKAYLGRLKSTYKTEDSYHSAVRTALRDNDPRIKEAALAQINGDPSERVRIAKLIIADGFEQDDVVTAINSEISAMTPDDDTGAKKEKGFYTVEDFVKEMANGDNAAASAVRDDVIQTAQKNGKTQEEAENSFVSSVKTQAKKEYLDGSLNDSQAEKILLAIGEDEEDVAPLVSYWSFIKAHPQYDLTQDKVEKYKEFAEPAEIPLDIFVQYVEGTKGLKTIKDEWGDEIESVRDQVLAVIDSLDLTWQQKDALYLAHELAESRIWDVPW